MGGSGGALGELWEAQGQLWEALAELREALGELWEGVTSPLAYRHKAGPMYGLWSSFARALHAGPRSSRPKLSLSSARR